MDINIDQIRCSKPRKTENTYVCQIYVDVDNKKEKLTLPFEASKITHIKHAYQPGDYILHIKNKGMYDIIYDISNYIIDYVKKNCSEWFGNNMNPELLEDYYSNPLFYTKDHGDIIRLKCINSPNINEYIDQKKLTNIYITFCNLRFYKQKFMIECKVEDIKPSNNKKEQVLLDSTKTEDDEFNLFDSDEDIPEPEPEIINNIKETYEIKINETLQNYKIKIDDLEKEIKSSNKKVDELDSILKELKESKDYKEIQKLCNQIEELTGQ